MQCPGVHPAVLEVVGVEIDLLRLQRLEFEVLAAREQCVLVLERLLLHGQFVLLPLVFEGTPRQQEVLLTGAAVDLQIDVHAALGDEHLLRALVLDGLLALLMGDVVVVPAHPHGPGDQEPGRRTQRSLCLHRPQHRLFGLGAAVDRERPGDRPRGLLQFAEQEFGDVAVPAPDEHVRLQHLPGQVDRHPELERVVVAGQGQLRPHRMDPHVHLVDGGPAPGRHVRAYGAAGRQEGVVLAPGRDEHQRVIDLGDRLAGHVLEACQLPHGQHRIGQLRVAVGILLPFGRTAEVGHRDSSP